MMDVVELYTNQNTMKFKFGTKKKKKKKESNLTRWE